MVTNLSSLLTSVRNVVKIGLACSQTLHFLFKVRRTRVIKKAKKKKTREGAGGGGFIDCQRKGVVSPQAYSSQNLQNIYNKLKKWNKWRLCFFTSLTWYEEHTTRNVLHAFSSFTFSSSNCSSWALFSSSATEGSEDLRNWKSSSQHQCIVYWKMTIRICRNI